VSLNVAERFMKAVAKDYRKDGIHVSHLIYDCMRKQYYNITSPQSFGRDLLMTFWWGTVAHLQQILEHYELPLDYNGITGTADEYEDGVLVDKKTTESLANSKYFPSKQHIRQVEYYSVMLRDGGWKKKCRSTVKGHVCNPKAVPVTEAKMLFISKDKADRGKTFECVVPLRPFLVIKNELLEKAKMLKEAIKTKTPPPRVEGSGKQPSAPNHWECGYCDHFKRCFGNMEGN